MNDHLTSPDRPFSGTKMKLGESIGPTYRTSYIRINEKCDGTRRTDNVTVLLI